MLNMRVKYKDVYFNPMPPPPPKVTNPQKICFLKTFSMNAFF